MFSRAGIIIFCLGITMADSESLLAPILTIAIGMLLVKIGAARGELEIEDEEEENNGR